LKRLLGILMVPLMGFMFFSGGCDLASQSLRSAEIMRHFWADGMIGGMSYWSLGLCGLGLCGLGPSSKSYSSSRPTVNPL
jgi:hypothetical protein